MNRDSVPHAILRAASWLAPGEQRAAWLKEWRSELWYVARPEAARFCLGAFRDALWVRRNSLGGSERTRPRLESPLACVAFLTALAAATLFAGLALPVPPNLAPYWSDAAGHLVEGCVAMAPLSLAFFLATRLVLGRPPGSYSQMPWSGRLRRGVFLALKFVLLQPIMLGGMLILVRSGAMPLAPLGICAGWILACRWVLIDQWRRCPVCLRLLTSPIRIGDPSHTFLEWYGAESACSRGHGLLHVPEVSASYGGQQQWLALGSSWRGLFSGVAGTRP